MTFEYTPDENDYLNYLYYVTTKSKRIQKKRTINKLVILFIYFIMGLYLYNGQGPYTSGIFFLLCLPTYFLYGFLERRQYLKHFKRYIKAHYSEEIGASTKITLDEEGIDVALSDSQHKILWSETQDINETGSHILIQEKNQNTIVIPKLKTLRVEELISELKRIAASHNIPYQLDLEWKWK